MKIGFIAMSGVRALDPELLEIGLTLPGFVERSKVVASLPSLGLLTLAGMTPDHHERSYHEVSDIKESDLDACEFDLVAISTFSAQVFEAYELADRFRARGIPVVLGGLHVTAVPDEALEHADAVVVGSGEPVWPQILHDVERGELYGIYDARQLNWSLDQAPMPAYELLDIDRYNRLTVQTARGCPWKCSFCASSILLTDRYLQKPQEKVLAEIDRIRELWPRPLIEFADDNTFVNKAYWKQLLPRLVERGIRWFTETDISVADDEELLDLMWASGCDEILIGLESPVREGLDGLETRKNWKLQRFDTTREAIRRIQTAGIRVNGCFIVGLDEHDESIFDRVFDRARELELYDVQVTYPTPFPGTPLYRQLETQGRLLDKQAWDRCTLFDIQYQPARMSVDVLKYGFHGLVGRLFSEDETRRRREHFSATYHRGHAARRQVPDGVSP